MIFGGHAGLVEGCFFMSNCKKCAKMPLCDWETPPKNCLDYREALYCDIDQQIYDNIDEYCEVICRGGYRQRGWIRGVDGDYLLVQAEDKSMEALDIEEGLLILSLAEDLGNDGIESKHDSF